eukprot:CAMPEP_0173160326 /NCGR_PEP_ID=MMETSP1105-20130129/17764_1 /TAXON_ID=2985 /ORGANISM="Ochromonas sp., Strain BG-1" /LENGTH=770 /DNA_ID=CAMNT_0014079181 /DNA_START=81 /DNA_END=2393 /DNA_ORIENTATION=+
MIWKHTLKKVERYYTIALQEPLNITQLAEITDHLYNYGENRGKILQRRTFSVADAVDPVLIAAIFQQQQVPLLHYFLNVFLLHQQNPHEKHLLLMILHRSIEMGLDINLPYKDDPPVYYKAVFIKEFDLLQKLISHNPKAFLADIIARSHKLHKFLKILYSLTPELIPMTKLLLHIEKIMGFIFDDFKSNNKPSSDLTQFNGSAILYHLLESARLDKPTLKPLELLKYSPTYQTIINRISRPEDAENTDLNVLKLSDIFQSLNDLVYSIFQGLLSSFQFSDRKYVALEHFFEIHLLVDEQKRNLFHYLTISNNVVIIRTFCDLWEDYVSHANSTIEVGVEGTVGDISLKEIDIIEFRNRILHALMGKDYRGHTALSYALMRFGVDSAISHELSRLISLLQSNRIEADLETELRPLETQEGVLLMKHSEVERKDEGTDLGGWDSLRIIDRNEESEQCDIAEIWDEVLPDAATFFQKYINTATPVIFRRSALLANEEMSKLRKVFSKETFLRKYGKLKVSTSSIPYGESFGVQPVATTLREIALHSTSNLTSPVNYNISLAEAFSRYETKEYGSQNRKSKNTTPQIPNYVFVTPPAQWGNRFPKDIPIPKPLILPLEEEGSSASFSYNLHAIASNTQSHGKNKTYSFELQFYLGSAGTGAPVHYHGHAINTLAYGEKKWLLYPVEDALYSTMTGLEFHAVLTGNLNPEQLRQHGWSPGKVEQFLNRARNYMQCTQHPGDILYVPPLYGHSTLNTMQSIGVAHEFSIESFGME